MLGNHQKCSEKTFSSRWVFGIKESEQTNVVWIQKGAVLFLATFQNKMCTILRTAQIFSYFMPFQSKLNILRYKNIARIQAKRPSFFSTNSHCLLTDLHNNTHKLVHTTLNFEDCFVKIPNLFIRLPAKVLHKQNLVM